MLCFSLKHTFKKSEVKVQREAWNWSYQPLLAIFPFKTSTHWFLDPFRSQWCTLHFWEVAFPFTYDLKGRSEFRPSLCRFPQVQLQTPPAWENSCFGKTDPVTSIMFDTHWPGHWVLTQGWRKAEQLHSWWLFCSVIACWGSCNQCKLEQSQDWQIFQRSRWCYSTIDSLIRVWYYWTSTWLKGICKHSATEPECDQENRSCKLVCTSISALRI